MEMIDNTIESATNYFREELEEITSSAELEQILQIVFYHYFKLERVDLILRKDEVLSEIDFKKINEVIAALKAEKH